MGIKEELERIERHEAERREWIEWLKLPQWEREERDYNPYTDEEPAPAQYHSAKYLKELDSRFKQLVKDIVKRDYGKILTDEELDNIPY